MMANTSKTRKTKRDKKAKRSSSYNKTPKMPKDSEEKEKIEGRAFKPGQGGGWSAPVGKRDIRRVDTEGAEKKRTRSDNYRTGTLGMAKVRKQKYQDRAADTKGITKIGKY